MCRIFGICSTRLEKEKLVRTAIEARDSMKRGGPDDAGIWADPNFPMVLAHRRLSIIDPDPRSAQPMEKHSLVITYNGEIYNYREIRKELEGKGYRFETESDTEVVLSAFAEWGWKSLGKFKGMWAFAIWDIKNRRLILSRDRIGVKPLYYTTENGFAFSSELKALTGLPFLKKELSKEAVEQYFRYGYVPSPLSIFKSVRKVQPGSLLIVDFTEDSSGKFKIEQINYWNFREEVRRIEKEFPPDLAECLSVQDDPELEEKVLDILEEILIRSFSYRMVADVPVGIFLSGGVDSSLLAALLQKDSSRKIRTFTIGFKEKDYDEAPFARKVAEVLGTDHNEHYISIKEALDIVEQFPLIYDEPFGDTSGIPTYLVSRIAREKVKVALSADGGDEFFCGYDNYLPSTKLARLFSKTPDFLPKVARIILMNPLFYKTSYGFFLLSGGAKKGISNFPGKYAKLAGLLSLTPDELREAISIFEFTKRYFTEVEIENILGGISTEPFLKSILIHDEDVRVLGSSPLQKMMIVDAKSYLPEDILVKVDRATMWASLEGRDPFLDETIAGLSFYLPDEFKCKNGISKYPLKKILARYIPKSLINRSKKGFGVPLSRWLRHELRKKTENYILHEQHSRLLRYHGIDINLNFVKRLWEGFLKGYPVNPGKIWLLLSLFMWAEEYLK